MTKGGYGIIYKATWSYTNETVILKRFENSKNIGKYFLNELKSLQHCFESYNGYIIETLKTIHDKKFIHRDFHSGNILCDRWNMYRHKWKIGDLGLSQAVNNRLSNNEIYGVIPYIAPEIFKGSEFSQKSDIYGFGMIMWELTTGCKPFADVEHDHTLIYKILDGERPKITDDTPKCYTNLMKSCWDPDPKKRPSIKEIHSAFCLWALIAKYKAKFGQAEAKRKKLIESKKLGPEFAEKHHSEAIYTSRALIALISKCSSVYSSSTISFGSNYISELDTESLSSTTLDFNYISAELEFDISTESLSSQNLNSMIQKFSTVLDSNYISTELELDIDTESSSSQNLSSTIQKFSTSLKRRRIDVDVEAHDNYESTMTFAAVFRAYNGGHYFLETETEKFEKMRSQILHILNNFPLFGRQKYQS
ncbi:kinase-like domain-containing protein [Rhizophagus irregularis DAOM 181602=DAOM 197198]|uniref:Kinase-like domain-containing protein n=1 Tax=Rhizophagus irregularis (strain DAOM 181602 / DAOM 197198 / MUCL 43194) TaxID=747089 RepID=A0A2P4P4S9_RHIID|nr:kinase-like domain-containing protein [Rhizophagus irregularis DAOM 181602=DAOM 197198]POG60391.1 kinase-like domain-containing protein [Rhizophagus irregularis DAOM 181602=DAOM 197198]|eukprot:XP_025167257.1 kinase-like domain-containing protein [Rhizophagus irregularis DAOM 181602=DAOM 197198]